MKAATALLRFWEGKFDGVLSVVPHENEIEAKVYCFEEILREIDETSDCGKVIVESFRDEYDEICLKVTPVYKVEGYNKDSYIIKTVFNEVE